MLSKIKAHATLPNLACLAIFIIGVVLRWRYVFVDHDPRRYVDSDMKMYIDLAKRFAQPGFTPGVNDVTHPPAGAIVFSHLYARDPTLLLACRFQFLISALVPLVVFALGWFSFGPGTGKAALAVSSAYFPFIDYGGYFLTEIPMTLLMAATLALFVWATKRQRPWAIVAGAFASGAVCSLAMSYKFLALPAMLCIAGAYWLFFKGPSRRLKTLVVAALIAGSLPLTLALTVRCTRANEGRFCPGSNKGGADFLLGHYGRLEYLTWADKKRGTSIFGSPSTYQHGYRAHPKVDFALTDGPQNTAEAWRWIRKNRAEAVVLSVEHVYDLFGGSLPWPSCANDFWLASEAWHFVFIILVFLPCLFLTFDHIKTHGFRHYLGSMDFLVLSPVLGLIAAVMVATGEPRYRVPFDTIFIVLAVEFYRRYVLSKFSFGKKGDSSAPAVDPLQTSEPAAEGEAVDPGKESEVAEGDDAAAEAGAA